MNQKKIITLSFVLGFSSIIAQTVILRTFQTVFYGNELSYAMILSSWLIWVALGSLITSIMTHKTGAKVKVIQDLLLPMTLCALALSVPAVIFGIRYIKPILDIGPGMMMGLIPMIGASFILAAPIGFFVGGVFVLLCFAQSDESDHPGIVYFWEALGAGVGGIAFSFVLLKCLSATMIGWVLAIVVLMTLGVVFSKEKTASLIVFAVMGFIFIFTGMDRVYHLDYLSQQKQYPFGKLLKVEDTPYANIAVVQRDENLSVYQNGMLSFTADDLLSVEENVHFPLLAHPAPERVLLVGNGLGGEINEILEYPETLVDFVEIDPDMIEIVRPYLPPHLQAVLNSPRLHIFHMDARHFVRMVHKTYDVVIVNVGDPYTTGLNRYYTLEFMQELDRILSIGGIASFRVSSSENFLSEETRLFLRSLYQTMKQVFPDVRSIPGDTHTFLVSNIQDRINLDPQWLIQRLAQSKIRNKFITAHTLPFRVTSRRMKEVEKILEEDAGMLNTDLFPRTYLFQIVMWSTHFNMGLKRFVQYSAVPFWLIFLIVCAGIFGLTFLKTRRDRLAYIDVAIATTGFSEIIFEIIVILAFQSLYGTAYDKIAIILASFMFGLLFGSQWANRLAVKCSHRDLIKIFSRIQFGIVIYPILLPLLFVIFRDTSVFQRWVGLFAFVFACLPFIAGFLGGMQYPLATIIRSEKGVRSRSLSGGFLYALDVFGASIGALVTGAFLIPLYGIVAVCVLCAAVNVIIFGFCFWARKG